MLNSSFSNTNDFVSIENGTIPLPRKTAFWAGFFYILTFVSIPTLTLYQSIHEPNYLLSNANDHKVVIGGILEIIVALSGIITAVILYTVFRKHNQTLAIGLISSRIVEAGTMFVGVAFLLGAVNLHQQAPETSSISIARTLVAMYDRIFVLGQGLMPAINDLLLGILLYQTRLVPRWLSLIGIIGAFPLFAGYFAIMFGVIERTSALAGASALMVAFFEFSLGIYLLAKAIKKS
jgi:hypothetical protein